MKEYTLVFPIWYSINSKGVILGLKKKGFGKDKWNGFGGKVEANETITNAAIRELREESGLEVKGENLTKSGVLEFHFEDNKSLRVHVFICDEFENDIIETDEMIPKVFTLKDIPYNYMWDDDQYWLKFVLDYKYIQGKFYFDKNNKIKKFNLDVENEPFEEEYKIDYKYLFDLKFKMSQLAKHIDATKLTYKEITNMLYRFERILEIIGRKAMGYKNISIGDEKKELLILNDFLNKIEEFKVRV